MHQGQPRALAAHLVFLSAAAIYAAGHPRLLPRIDFADSVADASEATAPQVVCDPPREGGGYLQRLTGLLARTEGGAVAIGDAGCEP